MVLGWDNGDRVGVGSGQGRLGWCWDRVGAWVAGRRTIQLNLLI